MIDFITVTVSNREPTEWYYLTRQFKESTKRFNCEPIVLSEEKMGSRFNGLGTKPRWLYKAITEKLINTSHIIFTDCWDIIFCTSGLEIMERYLSFGHPIVVSAERNCFPDDMKAEYDKLESPTPYKYLNSGFIVGETAAILEILEAMDLPNQPEDHRRPDGSNFHLNDQKLWLEQAIYRPDLIILDRYQALSQTLHEARIDEFDFSEKRIRNKITGSYPCTFHFNGSSKDNLQLREPILKHLNLL